MSDKIKLLEFYSGSCRPCRMMMPVVSELVSALGGITVEKVEISKESDRARAYGVKSVPTFVLLENGVEKKRIVGVQSKRQMTKFLSE